MKRIAASSLVQNAKKSRWCGLLLAEEEIFALLCPAGLLVVDSRGALLELLLRCLGLVRASFKYVASAATSDVRGALALTTDNAVGLMLAVSYQRL